MANIEAVERLLCERYNVSSLEGLGPLEIAVAAARAGDVAQLRAAIAERELYRWAAPIAAALDESTEGDAGSSAPLSDESAPDPEPDAEDPAEPVEVVEAEQEDEEQPPVPAASQDPSESKPRGRRRSE